MIKNKNKIKIMSILLIGVIFVISGCSSGPKPEETVENCLKSIQEGSFKDTYKYIIGENGEKIEESDCTDTNDPVLKKLKYEILESSVDGDDAIVKAKISVPDAKYMYTKRFEIMLELNSRDTVATEEEVDEKLEKILESEDLEYATNEIDIGLKKQDDKWMIVGNNEFLNAVSGNFLEMMESIDEYTQDDEDNE